MPQWCEAVFIIFTHWDSVKIALRLAIDIVLVTLKSSGLGLILFLFTALGTAIYL